MTDDRDSTAGQVDAPRMAPDPRQPSTYRAPVTAPPGAVGGQTTHANPDRAAQRKPTSLAEVEEAEALAANAPGAQEALVNDLIFLLDQWVDDAAPLNRNAFRPAVDALLERYEVTPR